MSPILEATVQAPNQLSSLLCSVMNASVYLLSDGDSLLQGPSVPQASSEWVRKNDILPPSSSSQVLS